MEKKPKSFDEMLDEKNEKTKKVEKVVSERKGENIKFFDEKVRPLLDKFFKKMEKNGSIKCPESYSFKEETRLFGQHSEVGRIIVKIHPTQIIVGFVHVFMKTPRKPGSDQEFIHRIDCTDRGIEKFQEFLLEIYPTVKNYK